MAGIFIQIKPNSDKNIDSIISETIHKSLIQNNLNMSNDSIVDLIEISENYIIELFDEDPVKYINSYFANINKIDKEIQFYEILTINKTDNKYNLLLINNVLNSANNLSDDVRKNNFNLIASGLSQYYNNSIANTLHDFPVIDKNTIIKMPFII